MFSGGKEIKKDLLFVAMMLVDCILGAPIDARKSKIISAELMGVPTRISTSCSSQYVNDAVISAGCTPRPGAKCDRIISDNFIDSAEVSVLLGIATKGMAMSGSNSILGPTIMDVNSGWVLPAGSHSPLSIYRKGPLFSDQEYDVYRTVTDRLKAHIEREFDLSSLFFTAPTFITREAEDLDGSWQPSTMHDEYWHPHVDKNNTEHYDYSGLVYLSTADEDFEGGELHFFDGGDEDLDCSPYEDPVNPGPCKVMGTPSLVVEPRAGRAVVFGSGHENPHRVTRVKGGTRFVLSFWFTCDKRREMRSFLDGKMHVRFKEEPQARATELSKERKKRAKRKEDPEL